MIPLDVPFLLAGARVLHSLQFCLVLDTVRGIYLISAVADYAAGRRHLLDQVPDGGRDRQLGTHPVRQVAECGALVPPVISKATKEFLDVLGLVRVPVTNMCVYSVLHRREPLLTPHMTSSSGWSSLCLGAVAASMAVTAHRADRLPGCRRHHRGGDRGRRRAWHRASRMRTPGMAPPAPQPQGVHPCRRFPQPGVNAPRQRGWPPAVACHRHQPPGVRLAGACFPPWLRPAHRCFPRPAIPLADMAES